MMDVQAISNMSPELFQSNKGGHKKGDNSPVPVIIL